jgi:hypothetical protein
MSERTNFPGRHPDLPWSYWCPTGPTEVDVINAREELLLRAQAVTRRIQERTSRAMGGERQQSLADPEQGH